MAVDVVCPHCDTTFHLQPDMLGKAMRCPECKEVFDVAAREAPPPREVPYERIENAAPAVILEAEMVRVKKAVPLPPIPKAVPLPFPAAERAEPAVQEADWRTAPPKAAREESAAAPVKTFDVPKPRRNIWPAVLAGLIVSIFLLLGGILAKWLLDESRKEGILAGNAAAAFKDRNFTEAEQLYKDVLAQYGTSPDAERYRFFEALSSLQASLGSLGLKDDPQPAKSKWDALLQEFSGSPLARTDDAGYGADIFEAGRRLADGLTGHAEDLLKKYRADLPKVEYLSRSEAGAKAARDFIPAARRYCPPDVPPLDDISTRLDVLEKEFVRERKRLDVLAPYRNLAENPVEERIAEFTSALARSGFSDDAEALDLIKKASERLISLLKPILEEVDPQRSPPAETAPRIVTVAAPPGVAPPATPTDVSPNEFFAIARGWLYALDADSGNLLWATPVGSVAPPLRFTLPESGAELALVGSALGGKAGFSARLARTGEPRWQQPLEAAPAGAAAIVGSRVYVPLSDAAGTFVEFDLRTGRRLGSFTLRQRIGAGLVRVPGTSIIAVAADARRIFFIDVAPQSPDQERLPMQLRGVLKTDHPELSVRVPPVFCLSGEGNAPTILLLQHEGTNTTKLRMLALPDLTVPAANATVPETLAVDSATATLPGQVTFAPAHDGERIAVATDAGAFGLYRTNAPGNLDSQLFLLPAGALPQDLREPLPALAAFAGEEGVWVFARGQRSFLQQSFSPATGYKALPRGKPQPAGLPMQSVQLFPDRHAAGLVVRSETTDSVRAVSFDLASGRVRWERQLGAVAVGAPAPMAGGLLLADADGGLQLLKADASAERLTAPLNATAGASRVAAYGDTVWTLMPVAPGRVQMRQVVAGKLALDVEAALPAAFAGSPIVFAGTVAAPLADGFLYKFDAASGAFLAGPQWRNNSLGADAISFVAANGAEELFTTDGGRRIQRWRWAAGGEWSARGDAITLRDKVAFAPAILINQLLVAETSGTISHFDLDRPDEPRWRWRPDEKNNIPAGAPAIGFQLLTANGKTLAVYAAGRRHLVAIDPEQAAPAWVANRDAADYDWLSLMVSGDKLIATDLAGGVTAFDAAGKIIHRLPPRRADLPAAAAVPLGDHFVMPLTDGTILYLPGPRKSTP